MKPCGTVAAYNMHRYRNETPCELCRAAKAEYERERRWRLGKNKPYKKPECGTYSGYNRHMYTKTVPCRPCKDASNAYKSELARRRRRGPWREVVADYLETHGALTIAELELMIKERHPDLTLMTLRKAVSRMVATGLVERADLVNDPYQREGSTWNRGIYRLKT